jgi:translation initiation factor IF-2
MKKEDKIEKPPVVVVLGHVDHGKSSLLEAVKDLKITEKEAGGITQHIGAYMVSHGGKDITFIDTPGHEAFFAMRSRGTKVADIGILVVAADESIKEQTKEAIEHLKNAEMPFIVAINKIDKKNIDIEKVKQDLSKEGIFVESYGGNVPSVNVSAKEKTGIEDLLEMILLIAEIEGLKSEKTDLAEGVVIEVQRDSKRGVVVTLLVKKGVLKRGDIIATECLYGKIKTMEGFLRKEMEEAGPSTPVQVTGLKDCPSAGDDFFVFKKLEDAKKFVLEKPKKESEEIKEDKKTLKIILKADVMGSLEAIEGSLEKIPQGEVKIKIIKADVGNVTESDIESSKTANAGILCFKVKTDKTVEKLAIRDKIEIDTFDIIYKLIEKVKEDAEKLLEDEILKTETGKIKVLAIFRTQKNRQILGGKVLKGEVKKGDVVEIYRNEEKIGSGKLINIKKEERDVEKILENEEFGMLLESKEKTEEGDILAPYKEEKVKKTL